jgi:crotonobetainyl-CoA:carnitine CoA-transferase CaiB-like acyl-CoA transferase
MGHFYLMANRNKRSIVLDLKKPEGRDAVLKLAEDADAVLTSIRPAAMQRLGLGYEDFTAVNYKIIYVALVGFGQDGPYAKRPAYDDVIQGLSGMADMQGRPERRASVYQGIRMRQDLFPVRRSRDDSSAVQP